MSGPFWSFLLDFPPVQRTVRSANDLTWETAQYVLASERNRHDAALRAAQEEYARHLAEVDAVNRKLRQRLAEQQAAHQEADRQRQWDRHQREIIDAELDRNTVSDLFCCQRCRSLWLLSSRPDLTTTVHGPIGDGCDTCRDRTLLRLTAAKAKIALSKDVPEIPRPVAEPPGEQVSLPGSRAQRADRGVDFVAELLTDGPDQAIAKTAAQQAVELVRDETDRITPANRCAGLSAIADGLDRVPNVVSGAITWCATEIMGVPVFLAKVIGVVVGHAALHSLPMHTIAQGIRAVGAVSCAADDRLGQCQCARHLLGDVEEAVLEETFAEKLHKITEVPEIDRMPNTDRIPQIDDEPSRIDDDDDIWHIGGL